MSAITDILRDIVKHVAGEANQLSDALHAKLDAIDAGDGDANPPEETAEVKPDA